MGWVVSVTPRPRLRGNDPPVPTGQEAGWAPRAGLDTEVRGKILSPLPGIEPRSPGRPARSQTLHWLSYPVHHRVRSTRRNTFWHTTGKREQIQILLADLEPVISTCASQRHGYFLYRYTISYPKFWKPKSSENRKFFHGGRLQPKYDGHRDNDDIDYPLLQDPQATCNVPLLHVYVQVDSLVWACLCLKFEVSVPYLEIKSTIVILWSIFIPLKINNAINNIYQLVLISCAILSLSS
jgi:hypothetical protein